MNTSTMFWKKVQKSDGCWEWTGSLNADGYGIVCLPRIRGRVVTKLAHRVSFETYVAPIPDGLFVCHHCDNRKCVRPDHLFIGTNADNMRDRKEKGWKRRYATHASEGPCSRGEQGQPCRACAPLATAS